MYVENFAFENRNERPIAVLLLHHLQVGKQFATANKMFVFADRKICMDAKRNKLNLSQVVFHDSKRMSTHLPQLPMLYLLVYGEQGSPNWYEGNDSMIPQSRCRPKCLWTQDIIRNFVR